MKTKRLRWMIQRDLPEVLDIEHRCFRCPWSEEDFVKTLRRRNCVGKVIESEQEQVVGYAIYTLYSDGLELVNLAVEPFLQRRGLGRMMIKELQSKVGPRRTRTRLVADVAEFNLDGQLFFRAMGFQAYAVQDDAYESDPGVAAYLFEYPKVHRRRGTAGVVASTADRHVS